jgi:5-methylcytosine-specific restriction endonuclease McrA
MAGGDYGRIRHTFWTDPDIKRVLTSEQKALLLYFFTSPHSNLIGLYYCPLSYAAAEVGLPIEQVRLWTFGALSRFVTYNEASEEVRILDRARAYFQPHIRKAPQRVSRPRLSPRLRRQVLSVGRCEACGRTERLEVDHIIPWSKGGRHDRENLQCLCCRCNRRKGARLG